MTLLTAKEALEIARKSDPEHTLRNILGLVKLAAERGKYIIQVREWGFGGGEYYCPQQQWPSAGKTIMGQLRELGFSADIKSAEGQFVDVWLEVSWAEKGAAA
jgi:hypothetical protein